MRLRPLVVTGPPRSGVRLTWEVLRESERIWTRDDANRSLFSGLLGPEEPERLREIDARRFDRDEIVRRLTYDLRNIEDQRPSATAVDLPVTEASLPAALQIGAWAELLPESVFLIVRRPPIESLSSAIDAWESHRFVSRPKLPGWEGIRWSFPLVEGWETLSGRPLGEVVVRQWTGIVEALLEDLARLERERWAVVDYAEVLADPAAVAERIGRDLGMTLDTRARAPIPLTPSTLSPPRPEKWRDLHPEALQLLEPYTDLLKLWEALGQSGTPPVRPKPSVPLQPSAASRPTMPPAAGLPQAYQPAPEFAADEGFAQVIAEHGVTVVASTYRSGRLLSFGAPDGAVVSSSVDLDGPMGIATAGGVLVVGTQTQIISFRHDPAAARVTGDGCDACYLPRTLRITGRMGVREVAYDGQRIWVVSSAFSCLAEMVPDYSFRPVWFPPFISAVAAEDRCHLNGVALAGGRPAFMTALGATDRREGWRDDKAAGGILMDVAAGRILRRGLSMPHSPRWHDGRLWYLESGKGELAFLNPANGEATTVARVPGFARGLAFLGRYAVIGLSQLRETVFRGLPIASEPDQQCGLWIVDRATGETVGTLRFDGLIQELFDVVVLEHRFAVIPPMDSGFNNTSFLVPPDSVLAAPPGARS